MPRSWDQKVVDLIRNCWAHEPAARPSFLAIWTCSTSSAAGLVEQDTIRPDVGGEAASSASSPSVPSRSRADRTSYPIFLSR